MAGVAAMEVDRSWSLIRTIQTQYNIHPDNDIELHYFEKGQKIGQLLVECQPGYSMRKPRVDTKDPEGEVVITYYSNSMPPVAKVVVIPGPIKEERYARQREEENAKRIMRGKRPREQYNSMPVFPADGSSFASYVEAGDPVGLRKILKRYRPKPDSDRLLHTAVRLRGPAGVEVAKILLGLGYDPNRMVKVQAQGKQFWDSAARQMINVPGALSFERPLLTCVTHNYSGDMILALLDGGANPSDEAVWAWALRNDALPLVRLLISRGGRLSEDFLAKHMNDFQWGMKTDMFEAILSMGLTTNEYHTLRRAMEYNPQPRLLEILDRLLPQINGINNVALITHLALSRDRPDHMGGIGAHPNFDMSAFRKVFEFTRK
jgi:hypothetical protein